MRRIGNMAFILMLMTGLSLMAQETMTLTPEQAVDYALQGNLTLKNDAITLRQTEREYKNSWNVFLPSLGGSGSLGYSDRLFSEEPSGYSTSTDPWSLSVGLSASLPLNVSAAPDLETARLQYEAGKISYEQARAGLRRDVLKSYYSLLTQEANLLLLEENALLAESTLKTVQIKFDMGLLPETDLLEARVNAGQLRNSFLNAQSSLENSMMTFLTLLGLPPETKVTLSGKLEPPVAEIAGDKALEAAAVSPSLQELLLNIRLLEKTADAYWLGSLTPTLSLGLSWQDSVSAPFDSASWEDGSWQDALSFTISLDVPLDGWIPGSSTDTQAAANRDNIESARNSYQLALSNRQTEIRGLLNSIKNAERSSKVSLENYELAQRNLDLTREAWRAGTRNLLDVGSSQADLLEAGQAYLLSLYDWIGYLLDLEYTLGLTTGELK